jgi:hypothetical protein
MLLGYARVSTIDQNLALQRDALTEAGCQKIFTEQISGAVTDRPALHEALAFARSGDTLIVWKLDRFARSMKQLIEIIEELRLREGAAFLLRPAPDANRLDPCNKMPSCLTSRQRQKFATGPMRAASEPG